MIQGIVFTCILILSIYFFSKRIGQIRKNIFLGRDEPRNDRPWDRWKVMFRVAFGQSKMAARPTVALLHFFVYAGFIIVNIEVLEIIIDGIFGTHRVLSFYIPMGLYNFLIGTFEYLALLVWMACVIFLVRRNVMKISRFWSSEMKIGPRTDANLILIIEILLMTAFLMMNAADYLLQKQNYGHYIVAGSFPVSNYLRPLFLSFSTDTLFLVERLCWWFHIVFILLFLNYVPYSKHLHILLSFPNTWYSNLNAKGAFTNMTSVTNEVKMMLDPTIVPDVNGVPTRFGAKDVADLTWKQLMDAYSCTECGRCTSECPANITGKKLSPRKIMMDTRDRLEEFGMAVQKNGAAFDDGKSLLFDYVSVEELWACTSCNACVQACPVNIDPLSIILDLRRFLVMEQSSAPSEINSMFSNIENNGAPWKFPSSDRMVWAETGV